MEKIKCPICNYDIYSTDTKCINCGSDKQTIEFELKRNSLINSGKIKDSSQKKKKYVILAELSIFVVIAFIYYILFIPRIINTADEYNNKKEIEECNQKSENWNDDLKSCVDSGF